MGGQAPPPLNLDRVFQRALPGVWTQVKLDTFPTNYVVLGIVDPPAGATRALDVVASGPGGADEVASQLQLGKTQFAGFRVTAGARGATPLFVFVRWLGSRDEERRPTATAELEFMKSYFHGVHAVVTLTAEHGAETEAERRGRLRNSVAEHLGSPWGVLDFSNSAAPREVEHYARMGPHADYFRPGKKKNKAAAAGHGAHADLDAKPTLPGAGQAGQGRPPLDAPAAAAAIPPRPPPTDQTPAALTALEQTHKHAEETLGKLMAEQTLLEHDALLQSVADNVNADRAIKSARLRQRLARKKIQQARKADANDYGRFDGIGDFEGETDDPIAFSSSSFTPTPAPKMVPGSGEAAESIARELQHTTLWKTTCARTQGDEKAALEVIMSTALRVTGGDAEAAFRLVQHAPGSLERHPEMMRTLESVATSYGSPLAGAGARPSDATRGFTESEVKKEIAADLIAELDFRRRTRLREEDPADSRE